MVMKHSKFYLSLILLLGVWSCKENSVSNSNSLQKQEEIKIIEWSNYGGDQGIVEAVIITKDSVIHSHFVAAEHNSLSTNRYQNTKENWVKLVNSLRLSDFRKIKSGTTVQPTDATDQKIYIETKLSSDSIINGYQDSSNYPKIKSFVKILDQIILENK